MNPNTPEWFGELECNAQTFADNLTRVGTLIALCLQVYLHAHLNPYTVHVLGTLSWCMFQLRGYLDILVLLQFLIVLFRKYCRDTIYYVVYPICLIDPELSVKKD